jgi:ribosome-associated protein
MAMRFVIRGTSIQLDQLLKASGLCSSGGLAKAEVAAGLVKVDGQVVTRKRAELHAGQVVEYAGETINLAAAGAGEKPT